MRASQLESLYNSLVSDVDTDDESAEIDDAEIASRLQSDGHGVFQVIYDRGHSAATERGNSRTDELEKELAEEREKLESTETQLTEEREKHPETEELRSEYQEEIREVRAESDEKISSLEKQLVNERRERAHSDLKAMLTSGQRHLDADYADVLTNKSDVRDRLRFDEDTGSLEVLQAGKQIALAPADGVSPLALLSKELKESAPSKFVEVSSDAGSGSREGGGAGNGSGGFFSNYRKELEEKRESEKESAPRANEAKKRMGLTAEQ